MMAFSVRKLFAGFTATIVAIALLVRANDWIATGVLVAIWVAFAMMLTRLFLAKGTKRAFAVGFVVWTLTCVVANTWSHEIVYNNDGYSLSKQKYGLFEFVHEVVRTEERIPIQDVNSRPARGGVGGGRTKLVRHPPTAPFMRVFDCFVLLVVGCSGGMVATAMYSRHYANSESSSRNTRERT